MNIPWLSMFITQGFNFIHTETTGITFFFFKFLTFFSSFIYSFFTPLAYYLSSFIPLASQGKFAPRYMCIKPYWSHKCSQRDVGCLTLDLRALIQWHWWPQNTQNPLAHPDDSSLWRSYRELVVCGGNMVFGDLMPMLTSHCSVYSQYTHRQSFVFLCFSLFSVFSLYSVSIF